MKLTISYKINAGIIVMVVLLLAASLSGFYGAKRLSDMLSFVTGPAWSTADGTMEGTIGLQRQLIEVGALLRATNQREIEAIAQQIEDSINFTGKALGEARAATLLDPQELKQLDVLLREFEIGVNNAVSTAKKTGLSDRDNLNQAVSQVEQRSHELLEYLEELEETADGKVEGELGNIASTTAFVFSLIGGTTIVAIVMGLLCSILARAQIAAPIQRVAEHLHQIASVDGDLTVKLPVKGQDEVAQLSASFNAFVGKIHNTISEVMKMANELAHNSGEMADISHKNRIAVNNQQQETSMVATAVNEMSASITEVSRNATDASNNVNQAEEQVVQGKLITTNTQQKVVQLSEELTRSSQVISQLQIETDNIGSVLDVIRGIAEQTNLLALNAAIEAARAGEQGRGFAVVADEVRTLATRTQQSTDEIQNMIQRLQAGAVEAVQSMDSSSHLSAETVAQARESERALVAIAEIMGTIRDKNFQVSTATEEQSAVSDEINRYILNINNAVEELNQSSEQNAETSAMLSSLAQQLQQQVSQFKT